MIEYLSSYGNQARFSIFVGCMLLFVLLEHVWPRRSRIMSTVKRWSTNLSLVVLSFLLIKSCMPLLFNGNSQNFEGVFVILQLPPLLVLVLTIAIMDFCIYWQHRIFHAVPVFWRFHKIHHTDRDVDATTGIRFHPFEMLLSALVKAFLIVLLGAPLWVAVVFEILLNVSALFIHANVKISESVDKWVRFAIVTPDMHRIHHSAIVRETDSNFGFFLSVWDRIFGSYNRLPELGHEGMEIGLRDYQDKAPESLVWNLLLPFKWK